MLEIAKNIFVGGMLLSLIFGVTLMIQLSRAAGNPKFDVRRNKGELKKAYSKEKAKKFKVSYYGIWVGNTMIFLGFISALILAIIK